MYLLTNPSPPRTHPTRRRIRFAKKRKRSATPPGKEREKTRRILRNGSHNNRGFFSIQNLQTDPSRGNVCKSYDTDRRNHHQYYRVHISRPGVHESRKTHTHTCAYTRRTHARTHTRTPKILIYRVPPRANRVPRVSTVSTPGLINDRWRNGTEYQRRRRPSALHGSRRWDRSATLNRSGVIEAIYTRPMRFHGREREGVTGRDRERKIERKKEKEREREREREREEEREKETVYIRSAETRCTFHSRDDRPIENVSPVGRQSTSTTSWRPTNRCTDPAGHHEAGPIRHERPWRMCTSRATARTGAKETFESSRESMRERPERGPISLEGTSIAPFP